MHFSSIYIYDYLSVQLDIRGNTFLVVHRISHIDITLPDVVEYDEVYFSVACLHIISVYRVVYAALFLYTPPL